MLLRLYSEQIGSKMILSMGEQPPYPTSYYNKHIQRLGQERCYATNTSSNEAQRNSVFEARYHVATEKFSEKDLTCSGVEPKSSA